MQECDILIVGAGPAGLSVASSLADDISCIIVHQDAEIGLPVRTSGGSFISDMHKLEIPPEYYQHIDKLDIYSDNAEASVDIKTDTMVVLDITGLYKYLASLSDKKNRQILCDAKFTTTEKHSDDQYVSEIRTRDKGHISIKSKYIVDASGWHCAVMTALDLGAKPTRVGVGTEFEFEQTDYTMNRAILFVGSPVLSGYGWVFPTNYNKIRLGVGVIKPDTNSNPRELMHDLITSGFLDKMGVKVPPDYTVNSGIIPSIAFQYKTVFGNVIRVGDAANCATPVAGEGIRIAIEQGRLLGVALNGVLVEKTPRKLQEYQTQYIHKYARDYKIGFWANQRISRYNMHDWDKSVRRLKYLKEFEITQILRSKFAVKAISKTMLIHLKGKVLRLIKGISGQPD